MTRSGWIMNLAAGLGASLATGCLPLVGVAVRPPPPAIWAEPVDEPPAVPTAETLSQPLPTARPLAVRPGADEPPRVQRPAERPPEEPDSRVAPSAALSPEPAGPEDPLLTALRDLLSQRPTEALESLKKYDKPNQEMLMVLLPLAAGLTHGSLDRASPAELAGLVEQLHRIERPLAARAALGIDQLCFCRRIDRFGGFERLAEDHAFAAGSADQPGELVRVYAELRNFACLPREGFYETHLTSTLEIHDYHDHVVWRQDFPTPPDRSNSPRQDYFISYRFWVPQRLPPGSYTLWVQVKDVTGLQGKDAPAGRTARRSLDFRVTGKGTAQGARGGQAVASQSGEGDHERGNQGGSGARR
jgi:hypothetical protein